MNLKSQKYFISCFSVPTKRIMSFGERGDLKSFVGMKLSAYSEDDS